jgi:hypothetical protein
LLKVSNQILLWQKGKYPVEERVVTAKKIIIRVIDCGYKVTIH